MTLQDKHILVTGATGLVGSNLIPRLLAEGAQVRATVHRRPPFLADCRIEYVYADLTRLPDCRRVVDGVDYVIMGAANTSGAAAIASNPMMHVTPNLVMNSLMLQAAYEANVNKFVWFGSTTGYPPTGDRPVTEDEMFDGEPYDKYYFVGWMKRMTEILCKMYAERLSPQMSTIILRTTNIYGENDDFEPATSHVTPALIRKVVERQNPLEVWGNGEDVRDLIHVEDVVEAVTRALATAEGFAAYNIGLGKTYNVKQILNLILELDKYADAEVCFNPAKPTMIPVRAVDTSRAEAELGFRAKIDLPEGLGRTIAWYRAQRQLIRPGESTALLCA